MHMRRQPLVWLSADAWLFMMGEADAKEPLETGGILAGYWANAREVVISAASGPGPDAVHLSHRFKHVPEYKDTWISNRYLQTKGIEPKHGDLHTRAEARTVGKAMVRKGKTR